ncbi:MAG: hypothetical protein WAK26_12515 [Terracidiphilus sp.]
MDLILPYRRALLAHDDFNVMLGWPDTECCAFVAANGGGLLTTSSAHALLLRSGKDLSKAPQFGGHRLH